MRTRSSRRWLVILAAAVVVSAPTIWGVGVLAGRVSRTGDDLTAMTDTDTAVPANGLTADAAQVDLGTVYSTEHTAKFVLRNPTGVDVRITQIVQTCSCMKATVSQPLLHPNESAEVEVAVRVSPKDHGAVTRFAESLHVFTENSAQPLALSVRGVYVPPIYYTSARVNIFLPRVGREFEARHELHVHTARGVEVTKVTASGFPLTVSHQAADAAVDGYTKVTLRLSGTHDSGMLPQSATVYVYTNEPVLPPLNLQVVLRLPASEQITPSPAVLGFGVVAGGATKSLPLRVRLPHEGVFRLDKIETSDPNLTTAEVSWERGGGSDDLMTTCSFAAPATPGSHEGYVVVHVTGRSGKQAIRIPTSAFVR